MPHLTALASRSLVFERAYAVYPESVKGLFATLCSRAPAFDVPTDAHAKAPCTPLAGALREAGYRTALFHSGRFAYLGMEALLRAQQFDTLEDAGTIGGDTQSSFGVDEPSAVRGILSWVDSLERGRRFFVAYLPAAGHHPYATEAPGPFRGTGDFTNYQNALHEGDQSLGALVDGLRHRGLERETLFVFVGDHGEAFGQHDGNYGHSLFIYDENVRVPLVVAVPGAIAERVPVPAVASTIDLAPTVLDLLGLPVPRQYDGESLLGPSDRMALFYTDYSSGLLGLQDRCWKYHFEIASRRSRLFDSCADPGETVDRSADHPERVRAYRTHLERWSGAERDRVLNGR